jgi:hypothetical protein
MILDGYIIWLKDFCITKNTCEDVGDLNFISSQIMKMFQNFKIIITTNYNS